MSCPFTGAELGSNTFFCYKAEKESDVSFSSLWAFGPEFKTLTVKPRYRARESQTIIYDYQMHQFYWFWMAICNLSLQEETSRFFGRWTSGNPSQVVAVNTTELFQIFSLSPAYPGCVWTWYGIRSTVPPTWVWTEVTWRLSGPCGVEGCISWSQYVSQQGRGVGHTALWGHWSALASLHTVVVSLSALQLLRLFVASHSILTKLVLTKIRFL